MKELEQTICQMSKDAISLGNKAAADIAFKKLGVGLDVLVFRPGEDINVIKKALRASFNFKEEFVVRFSRNNEIDLPVGLNLKTPDEIIEFINANRKEDYTTIVCPSFNIKNSFEVYYENDIIYVSVLPGKWDITTNEPTDTVVIEGDLIKFIRYDKERVIKSDCETTASPFSFDELHKIANFIIKNKNVLGALKGYRDPLFIRGWQNYQNDFCFANCRKSNYSFEFKTPDSKLFVISNESDVNLWDGRSEIYFNMAAESRGNDFLIYKAARRLVEKGAKTVFCNSVLSHQSILLREAGLKTIQTLSEFNYSIKYVRVEKDGNGNNE
jgi:hypothetical protein